MADNVGMTDGSSALNPDYDNAANSSSADTQNAEPASNIIDITSHQRPRAEFDGSQAVTTDDARTSPKFGDGPKIIPFNNNDSLTVSTTQSQDFDGDQLMPIETIQEPQDEGFTGIPGKTQYYLDAEGRVTTDVKKAIEAIDEGGSNRELTADELAKLAYEFGEGLLSDFSLEGDPSPEVQALGEEVADSLRFQLDASKIWKGIRDTYDKVSPVARDIWEGLKASWKSGDAINVSIDELANKKEDVNITAPKEINIAHLDEESINTLVSNTVNLGGQVMIRTEGNVIIVDPANVEAMQKAGYRIFNPAVESVMPSPEDEQLAAQAVDEVLAESGGDGENEDPDFKGNVLYKLARAGVRGFIGTGRLIKDIESQGVGKYKTRMLDENGKEIAWKDMSGWQKLRYVLEDVTGVHTNDSFVRAEDVDAARLVDVFRKRGLTVSKQLLDDAGVEQPGILGEGSLIDRMIKSGSVVDGITMGFRVASMLQPLDIAAKTNFFAQNSVLSPRTLSMVFPAAVRSWRTRSEILRRGGSEEEANKVMMLGLAGALPVGFISYFLANDLAHGVANDIISKLPEGVNTEFTQRLVSTVVPWATSWGIRTGSSKLALPIIQYPLAYVIAGNKDAQGNNIGVKRRAFKAAGLSWKAADIASNAAMGIGAAQYLGVLPHAPGLGVNMLRNLTGSMVENQNTSLPNLGNSQAESIAALINSDPQAISRGSFGRSEILSTLRERQFTLGNYERQLEDLQRDPTRLREFIQRNGGNPQMVENEIVRVKNEITRIESQIDSPEMRSRGIFGREGSDESSSERFIDQRPTHSNNATRMQEMFETSDNRRGGFIDLNSQNLEQTLGRMTPEEFNDSVFDVTNKSDHAVSIRVAGLLGDDSQTIISIQPGQSLHQAIIIEGLNPSQLNLTASENRAFWANELARHGEFKEVQDLIDSSANQQQTNVVNENYNPQLRPHVNQNNQLDDQMVGEQRNRQVDVNTQNQEVAPEVERNRIVAGTIDRHNIGNLTPGDTVVGRIRTELDTMISSGNYQSAINGAMLQFQSYSPAQQDLFIQELTSRNLLTSSQANALFGRAGDLASLNNLLTENPNTLVMLQTILNRHEYELLAAASGSTTPFGTSGPVTVFKEVVAPLVPMTSVTTSPGVINYVNLNSSFVPGPIANLDFTGDGVADNVTLPPSFILSTDKMEFSSFIGLLKASGVPDSEILRLVSDSTVQPQFRAFWIDLIAKTGDTTDARFVEFSDLENAGIINSAGIVNKDRLDGLLEDYLNHRNTLAFRLGGTEDTLARVNIHMLQSDATPEQPIVNDPFANIQVVQPTNTLLPTDVTSSTPVPANTQQPQVIDLGPVGQVVVNPAGSTPTQLPGVGTPQGGSATGTPQPPIVINGQDAGEIVRNAANDAVNQVATSLPHDTAVGINNFFEQFNGAVNQAEAAWNHAATQITNGNAQTAIQEGITSFADRVSGGAQNVEGQAGSLILNDNTHGRTLNQILDDVGGIANAPAGSDATNRGFTMEQFDKVFDEIGRPLSPEMRSAIFNHLSHDDSIISIRDLENLRIVNPENGNINMTELDNKINVYIDQVNATLRSNSAEILRGRLDLSLSTRTIDEIINQSDVDIALDRFTTTGYPSTSPEMQSLARAFGLFHSDQVIPGSEGERRIIENLLIRIGGTDNAITLQDIQNYIGTTPDGKLDIAEWQYLFEREMRLNLIGTSGLRPEEILLGITQPGQTPAITVDNMQTVFRELDHSRLSYETKMAILKIIDDADGNNDGVITIAELEAYNQTVNGINIKLLNDDGTVNPQAMDALIMQAANDADSNVFGDKNIEIVHNPNNVNLIEEAQNLIEHATAPTSNLTADDMIRNAGNNRDLVEIVLGNLPDNLTPSQRNDLITSLVERLAKVDGNTANITAVELARYLGTTDEGYINMQNWVDVVEREMQYLGITGTQNSAQPIFGFGIPGVRWLGFDADIATPLASIPLIGPQWAGAVATAVVAPIISTALKVAVVGYPTNRIKVLRDLSDKIIGRKRDATGKVLATSDQAVKRAYEFGRGAPMIGSGIAAALMFRAVRGLGITKFIQDKVEEGILTNNLPIVVGAVDGALLLSGSGPAGVIAGGIAGGIAGAAWKWGIPKARDLAVQRLIGADNSLSKKWLDDEIEKLEKDNAKLSSTSPTYKANDILIKGYRDDLAKLPDRLDKINRNADRIVTGAKVVLGTGAIVGLGLGLMQTINTGNLSALASGFTFGSVGIPLAAAAAVGIPSLVGYAAIKKVPRTTIAAVGSAAGLGILTGMIPATAPLSPFIGIGSGIVAAGIYTFLRRRNYWKP